MELLPHPSKGSHREAWLHLGFGYHSDFSGGNRLWGGCAKVWEGEDGSMSQLGCRRQGEVSRPHIVILLASCTIMGFPELGDLGQVTFLLLT